MLIIVIIVFLILYIKVEKAKKALIFLLIFSFPNIVLYPLSVFNDQLFTRIIYKNWIGVRTVA